MAYLDTLTKKVNILPTGIPTPVHLSQSENGRSLSFEIIGGSGELPAGSVVTLTGTKPDGVVYSTVGTLSGNIATFEEDVQLTAAAGVWPAKIEVTNGGHMIATGRISFTIDADPVAPGSVPSESELDGLVAQAAMYAETARSAAYGSPLTAATAADMIDTTRVYVYTGSEAGMETGHWYYWEDGSWKDGGIYNAAAVQTDTSLSIPGMAADAAATGRDIAAEAAAREQADAALQTAIATKADTSALTAETEAREQADADLKADLTEFEGGKYQYLKGTFQNGGLSSGDLQSGQKWRVAETDIISYDRDITLIIESGYRIGVHIFVNGSFSSDSGWQTGTYKIPANTTFKMVIAKTTEDASSIANVIAFKSAVKFQSVIDICDEKISSISEVNTKNLSPTANAVTTGGGYLNGSTGTFGTVENGKTYTFSAYNESDKTYGVTIRIDNGGWKTQATVNPIANGRFSVAFTANVSGDISLSTNYGQDYNPLFSQIQLEEGSIATDYIPYHQRIAVDLVARAEASKPSSKFSNVLSIGHQGYNGYGAPYNTLKAFSDAKEYGFEWIETDIKMTLDRVPVITHDEVRTTVGGQSVVIAETTYEQLMTYQFYSDASIKIPTLWETLNLCNEIGLGIFIEFKGYDFTLEEVETIINKAKRSTMPFAFSGWSEGPLVSVRTIDESLTVLKNIASMPTITDLKTSDDYAQLRTLLSQKGRTCIYCDIPNGTSDDWFEELLALGYSFVIGNNDSTSVIKNHIKYAFALTNTRTVFDVLL